MKKKFTPTGILAIAVALLAGAGAARADAPQVSVGTVTQTHASLEAPRADGFQYKYGTLLETNEFDKTALAPDSDPLIFNQGSYAWKQRSSWVESYYNISSPLPAGKMSEITVTTTVYEPATLSFEWAVDSEEGIGKYELVVDGEVKSTISGLVDWTPCSIDITKGTHTIVWRYNKTSATNLGMDLAKLRKVDLRNTTSGTWIDVPGDGSVELTALYPGQNYLCRAYRLYAGPHHETVYGAIKEFKSLPISFGDLTATDITQTKARITGSATIGDAPVTMEYQYFQFGKKYQIDSEWHQNSDGSYYISSYKYMTCFRIYYNAGVDIAFQFKYYVKNTALHIRLDNEEIGWFYKNVSGTYNYNLPSGAHEILIIAKNNESKYGAGISDIEFKPSKGFNENTISSSENVEIPLSLLNPNSPYSSQMCMKMNMESPLAAPWNSIVSKPIEFTTLPVIAETLPVAELRQASVTLRGNIAGGDATIVARGLQYRDKTGQRWTDFPATIDKGEITARATRLRPATDYVYRAYIQAKDCDTVFSTEGTFKTLPVVADKPVLVEATQHTATVKGIVHFGDAQIYIRGMQFRKKGATEWTEIEDDGTDSTYTLVRDNLEMGASYEVRTYIQPAGCDVIYSPLLTFNTQSGYVTVDAGLNEHNLNTQSSVTCYARVLPTDPDVTPELGFIYRIYNRDFNRGPQDFIISDEFKKVIKPTGSTMSMRIVELAPDVRVQFRAYSKIGPDTLFTDWAWQTCLEGNVKINVKEITQSKAVFDIEACVPKSFEETPDRANGHIGWTEYTIATKPLGYGTNVDYTGCEWKTYSSDRGISDLEPNTRYYIVFRQYTGLKAGYVSLYQLYNGETSYTFTTKDVDCKIDFSDITQTTAKMTLTPEFGDIPVSSITYSFNGQPMETYTTPVKLTGLYPGRNYNVAVTCNYGDGKSITRYASFTTREVTFISTPTPEQTSVSIKYSVSAGDWKVAETGVEFTTQDAVLARLSDNRYRISELNPNTSYTYTVYARGADGTFIRKSFNFRTADITTETVTLSNLSNRSATLHGMIDCDAYSTAEFGFQWQEIQGWTAAPRFTKGVKLDDGTITVSLVNGMLSPDTDHKFRTAVRYKGVIYAAEDWQTFRTEKEFVLYPGQCYTILRTDSENNCLVLCGYYVAGSEEVTAQGYEYWRAGSAHAPAIGADALAAVAGVTVINTDESMYHLLPAAGIADGTYLVRAFMQTASGKTYGQTLSFSVSGGNFSAVDDIEADDSANVQCTAANGIISVKGATGMQILVCDTMGRTVSSCLDASEVETFNVQSELIYIVRVSNGAAFKVRP